MSLARITSREISQSILSPQPLGSNEDIAPPEVISPIAIGVGEGDIYQKYIGRGGVIAMALLGLLFIVDKSLELSNHRLALPIPLAIVVIGAFTCVMGYYLNQQDERRVKLALAENKKALQKKKEALHAAVHQGNVTQAKWQVKQYLQLREQRWHLKYHPFIVKLCYGDATEIKRIKPYASAAEEIEKKQKALEEAASIRYPEHFLITRIKYDQAWKARAKIVSTFIQKWKPTHHPLHYEHE
jgi:hypothetical protein